LIGIDPILCGTENAHPWEVIPAHDARILLSEVGQRDAHQYLFKLLVHQV
jgi:hypothetical protein